jgi:hypothetical protein
MQKEGIEKASILQEGGLISPGIPGSIILLVTNSLSLFR